MDANELRKFQKNVTDGKDEEALKWFQDVAIKRLTDAARNPNCRDCCVYPPASLSAQCVCVLKSKGFEAKYESDYRDSFIRVKW